MLITLNNLQTYTDTKELELACQRVAVKSENLGSYPTSSVDPNNAGAKLDKMSTTSTPSATANGVGMSNDVSALAAAAAYSAYPYGGGFGAATTDPGLSVGVPSYGLLPSTDMTSPAYPGAGLTAGQQSVSELGKYDPASIDPTSAMINPYAAAPGWPSGYSYFPTADKLPSADAAPQISTYMLGADQNFYTHQLPIAPIEPFAPPSGAPASIPADLYGSNISNLSGSDTSSVAAPSSLSPTTVTATPPTTSNGGGAPSTLSPAAASYASLSAASYNPGRTCSSVGPAGSTGGRMRSTRRARSAMKDSDDDLHSNEDVDVGRRQANNTRERIRVRDINSAFKELGKMCTQHLPNVNERNLTKLNILHQAVEVITQLEEQVG
ncbi:Helix-loop-helix DNA-binding domain containing protein [Aphelenchoides avenae]|nr:Helix-loop-helix DNA-binding domain containing protein [Aphelenchus avenae]